MKTQGVVGKKENRKTRASSKALNIGFQTQREHLWKSQRRSPSKKIR